MMIEMMTIKIQLKMTTILYCELHLSIPSHLSRIMRRRDEEEERKRKEGGTNSPGRSENLVLLWSGLSCYCDGLCGPPEASLAPAPIPNLGPLWSSRPTPALGPGPWVLTQPGAPVDQRARPRARRVHTDPPPASVYPSSSMNTVGVCADTATHLSSCTVHASVCACVR